MLLKFVPEFLNSAFLVHNDLKMINKNLVMNMSKNRASQVAHPCKLPSRFVS